MRFLIATPIRLILWDGHPHVLAEGRQEDGNGNFTGITWDESALYVAGSVDFRYAVHVFDRDFRHRGTLPRADLHQTHQIVAAYGKLYCTNTGKNRVEVWDGRAWAWRAWNPSPCDMDHVNGIWPQDGMLWVTEFRHRPDKPSLVRRCDPELTEFQQWTVEPPIHNVYVEGPLMYNLVSRPPKGLIETDLATGEQRRIEIRGEENNLIRGLARTPGRWHVGLSRWEPERGERHKGDAVVVTLDDDFEEVGRITLPDAGPVCGLRALEGDLAHNGVVW